MSDMPELPEPFCNAHEDADSEWPDMYADHQMHEYARQYAAQEVAKEREACWKAARAGLFKAPVEYEFSRDIVDHYVCGAIRARYAG